MNLSPAQIRQVLAIDRFRHFGRAAEYLGVTQPGLSRSLQALEHRLGLVVFRRDRSGVEPTRAGLRVLEFATMAESAAQELARDLELLRDDGKQSLRVASGAFAAEISGIPAAGSMGLATPELSLSLNLTDWFEALALLRENRCDLTFCELNPDFLAKDLETRPVADHAVYFFVRPGHPLAGKRSPTLQEILSYPWATSRIPMRALTHIGNGQFAAGSIDLSRGMLVPRIVSTSVIGALGMLGHGNSIAISTLGLADPWLEQEAVVLLDFRAPWLRLNYGFAWRSGAGLPPIADRFMATVEEIESGIRERELQLTAAHGL